MCRSNTWGIRGKKTKCSYLKAALKGWLHLYLWIMWMLGCDLLLMKYPAACASACQICKIFIKMFKNNFTLTVFNVFNAVSDVQEKLGCFEWQAETETPPWIEPCARHACINTCINKWFWNWAYSIVDGSALRYCLQMSVSRRCKLQLGDMILTSN